MKKTLLFTALLGASAVAAPKIGLDQPRNDTDFWTAFARYVPEKGQALEVELFTPRPTTTPRK